MVNSHRLKLQALELMAAQEMLREAKEKAGAAEATRSLHQSLLLPHRTYTPKMEHDGASWVAVAEFSDGTKLVGRGGSPNEALMDYNSQWLGMK